MGQETKVKKMQATERGQFQQPDFRPIFRNERGYCYSLLKKV
jgi:hypothetical protein